MYLRSCGILQDEPRYINEILTHPDPDSLHICPGHYMVLMRRARGVAAGAGFGRAGAGRSARLQRLPGLA